MPDLKDLDKKYIANTYNRFPLELCRGEGALMFDEENREYIDLGSGIGVTSFGSADTKWCSAVENQAKTLSHTSNLYYTAPAVRLARLLCEKSGLKKAFFCNSGAEANECAIKTARLWAEQNKGENCVNIITIKNSFHGRTVATLAATGQDSFHSHFGPFPEGFLYCEPDINKLSSLASAETTAALMLECIQGEGGVVPLPREFLLSAEKLCRERNILLIIDEVQTGNGRTGYFYAYQKYNLSPDIVTTAKGLGGGLPIGAALFAESTENTLTPGSHGSTFGGNPICCAAAESVVSRIDEDFLKSVREKGDYIFETLRGKRGIESVDGAGLMIGIKPKGDAAALIAKCRSRGVLCLAAKDKIRLLPPLNIPLDLLKKAIGIIAEVCAEGE